MEASARHVNSEDVDKEQRFPIQVGCIAAFRNSFHQHNARRALARKTDLGLSSESVLQIFPDPVEVVPSPNATPNSLDHGHKKERLPSIVVEPTELSEVESGELRWPPETMDTEEDEEDLFLEQCIPPANIADWGEEEEEEVGEETLILLTPQPGLTLIGELDEVEGRRCSLPSATMRNGEKSLQVEVRRDCIFGK